jgi:polyisoprenoid-binding protein YceI
VPYYQFDVAGQRPAGPPAANVRESKEEAMTDLADLTRVVDGARFPLPGTYVLDKTHTTIGFVARHLVVTKVRGQFDEFEGALVIAETPGSSSVSVSVDVGSIDTHEKSRDDHLRSADFFEHDKHPQMTFRSTSITAHGAEWKVVGDLTIRGVTRPLTLDVEFNGATNDPWGGTRLGISAHGEVVREDFGVSFGGVLDNGGAIVGSRVKIEIESELILQA